MDSLKQEVVDNFNLDVKIEEHILKEELNMEFESENSQSKSNIFPVEKLYQCKYCEKGFTQKAG